MRPGQPLQRLAIFDLKNGNGKGLLQVRAGRNNLAPNTQQNANRKPPFVPVDNSSNDLRLASWAHGHRILSLSSRNLIDQFDALN
jgi:hypothetical protein